MVATRFMLIAGGTLLKYTEDDAKRCTRRWYVVHSRPNQEAIASMQLRKQGFTTFLPLTTRTRRHARKTETVLAPLFPRYLFVRLDLLRDRWRSVNGTYGVARMVMFDDVPAPVPIGLVEALEAAVDCNGRVRRELGVRVGQDVQVVAGPFSDLVGKLETLGERGRVQVLLRLLGRGVRVSVPVEALAPTG